jgi:hypothetical protein
MGAAAAMGAPVRCGACALAVALIGMAALASAEERYALIVTGATGGEPYAEQYGQWSETLTHTLVERLQFDPAHVVTLSETPEADRAATAVNVRRLLVDLRQRLRPDDLVFIVLMGHGTFDGVDAKFNLVGPDLEAAEWAALLGGLPGRLVVVNSTAGSFPFLERLAGPRRIVITATDSVAQRFDTVFPEHFVAALAGEGADIDKNGRISMWEAFAAAAGGVRRHYQQRGQLATERPLLDDNGDGVGREAAGIGAQQGDGSLASRTYLDKPMPGAAPTDEVMLKLLQQRAALEAEAEELQIKRVFMPPAEYAAEFERVMIELARVSRAVRQRAKS